MEATRELAIVVVVLLVVPERSKLSAPVAGRREKNKLGRQTAENGGSLVTILFSGSHLVARWRGKQWIHSGSISSIRDCGRLATIATPSEMNLCKGAHGAKRKDDDIATDQCSQNRQSRSSACKRRSQRLKTANGGLSNLLLRKNREGLSSRAFC